MRTNPHGAVATGTDGGVDGKDAGEQGGPGDPRWRALGRWRGGQRGQLGIAMGDEQRQLVGLGVERLELGHDERPEMMAAGEDAVVANGIEARRRDEGGEAGEPEVVAGDGGEAGADARGMREVDADATVEEGHTPRPLQENGTRSSSAQ